jgi:hypothetical protein
MYRVKATPQSEPFPPEIRSDGSIEQMDAITYYPDSMDRKTAQRLEVKAGAEVSGIQIKLARTPIVKVSGKVTGVPPGKKDLLVMAESLFQRQPATLKPDGTFVIWRLVPGEYTLQAHYFGPSEFMSAPVEIELSTGNLEHVDLSVAPPFDIAGQLRFDDDQARQAPKPSTRPAGTSPPASPQPRRLQIYGLGQARGSSTTTVADDDTFTMEKVQPGRYIASVFGVSGYVKSVRIAGKETDGDILDVRSGAPGPVTVTLSSNRCEISGTVSDSNGPVTGATVGLVEAERRSGGWMNRSQVRLVHSDSAGTYKFRVPPGTYRLAAVDGDLFDGNFQGADLEDYEPETIELSAGDKITKDLVRHK